MTAPVSDRQSLTPLQRWYRHALPSYWIFLTLCTHFPGLKLRLGGVPHPDRYFHSGAFALLTVLYWKCYETFRAPRGSFVWVAALVLPAYAALDEITQGPFGRTVSLDDWLSGCTGIVAALLVLELHRRARHSGSRRAR